MTERAVLASRSGGLTPWFAATVDALGYDSAATLTVDGPEHGRYHLPPGLVDRLDQRVRETGATLVAVDEVVHPGQMVDLADALAPVTLRDRRGVVWKRLAATNPVAEQTLALRDCRIERRRVARADRDSATDSPAGTGGRVDELDRRVQQLRDALERHRADGRERVTAAHDGVDARVTLLGSPTAPTGRLWAALTDETGPATGPFRPARPAAAVTTAGPHEIVLTDTPGVVAGAPDWYTDAVPGTSAAIARADVLVVVGERPGPVERRCRTLRERGETPVVPALPPGTDPAGQDSVDSTDPGAVRTAVAAALPSAVVDLLLPYSDGAHALVSQLHDRDAVRTVAYDDRIALTAEVPASGVAALRRQVDRLGGECDP
jgi:hypothetical protein